MPSEINEAPKPSDLFQFPEVGSYLEEAVDGQRTPLMNEGWDDQDDDTNDVPVRILNDFVFFDPRTRCLVSLNCLSEGRGFCEGFGWALAESDEEDQDDSFIQDDGILLHLGNILKWSLDIHKECIWILTEHAWYILQLPSRKYRPFFTPFYTNEILLRVVLRNILKKPALSPQEFFHLISLPAARDYLLDRCWTKEDLVSNFRYSHQELQDIIYDIPGVSWEDVKNAPLLNALLRNSEGSHSSHRTRKHEKPLRATSRNSRAVPSAPASPPQVKKTTTIRRFPTTVSHTVHSLISPFFNVEFTVVGKKADFLDEAILFCERPDDQVSTEFTDSLKPGDFVIVNEGDHWDESQNRFAQIIYLASRGKTFHARWFIHGSQTILEELAFGQELFLSVADDCKDVSVDCVVGICEVVRLSLEERSHLQWPTKNTYFFSSAWDKNNPADFVEVKDDQVHIPSSRFCKTCDSRQSASSFGFSRSCFTINQQEYHKHDFIRYRNTDPAQLTCSFGQVIAFNNAGGSLQIKVCRLGRMVDRRNESFCVENELFMTHMVTVLDPNMVLGTCRVNHISHIEDHLTDCGWFDQHPLSFYVQYQANSFDSPLTLLPVTALNACDVCRQDQIEREKLEVRCRKEMQLRAFDPFIGCGGFGLGLSRGCSMHTTLGVELNSSAAETTRKNFSSDTVILNKDASHVLQQVARGKAGLPHKHGEIDLIYTGPPCQNDSTLNRHKTDRKCLAFTALSFLDILRPPFFVMESVPGFLHWEVQGSIHKIKAGDLKLVLKVLHFLGYNVMGRLLHARSFGDPQTRSRFFIVATLPKCGDFTFPEATHGFKPGQSGQPGLVATLGQNLKVRASVSRAGCALHEVVTTSEALSDLPLFDWTSTMESTAQQEEAETAHSKDVDVTMVSCGVDELWGIQDATFRYKSPPANVFQHRARRDLGLSDPQYQHFTKHFSHNVVRNVCEVPVIRGADYRHLDQGNREWCLRDPASAKAIRGFQAGAYTRLDPDGYFHTIVTNVGPTAKQSAVLHPIVCTFPRIMELSKRIEPHSQCKRILTVRELARAQGFPDDFVFCSETDKIDDYHKQIGNSVPFGMSAALGRAIQDVVFRQWKLERGETL